MRHPEPWGLALMALVMSTAGPALAHVGGGTQGGFAAGLLHPVSGADHLLAMVAVGLWGAVLGRPLIYALPVVFPMMMAAGGILGILAVPLPPVEVGIALSVLLLGAAIAAEARPPVALACVAVGLFGIFHGYAHGRELPEAASPLAYSAGFVLMTGSLHLAGILLGLLRDAAWGRIATRGIGGLIALAGLGFLAAAT